MEHLIHEKMAPPSRKSPEGDYGDGVQKYHGLDGLSSKAPEDRRSPKPSGHDQGSRHSVRFWTAPILWRFGLPAIPFIHHLELIS